MQNTDTKGKNINRKHTIKIYIRLFHSTSSHQALAGSAPRLSTRGTSVFPQQITKQTFCGWCKKVRLFKQKLRPILRWLCWFKSSGSGCRGGSRVASSVTQYWRFSPANQWSVEFTRHVLVMVRIAWNLSRGGIKKVPGTRYSTQWKNPQKLTVLNRTVSYHAVEKRHKKLSILR